MADCRQRRRREESKVRATLKAGKDTHAAVDDQPPE
jgi:hypothetical protein